MESEGFLEFKRLIRYFEGFREKAYWDRSRYSIGYGTYAEKGQTITKPEAEIKMSKKAEHIYNVLFIRLFPSWYGRINTARRIALCLMIYQMGYRGVLNFKNMVKSIREEDWHGAAFHALDSNWAEQTPKRAKKTARIIYYGRIQ